MCIMFISQKRIWTKLNSIFRFSTLATVNRRRKSSQIQNQLAIKPIAQICCTCLRFGLFSYKVYLSLFSSSKLSKYVKSFVISPFSIVKIVQIANSNFTLSGPVPLDTNSTIICLSPDG